MNKYIKKEINSKSLLNRGMLITRCVVINMFILLTNVIFLLCRNSYYCIVFVKTEKKLVENTLMLNEESFTCVADVGYPSGRAQTVLQANRFGVFENFYLGNTDRQKRTDNCVINETLVVKLVKFDTSWNNTRFRCAVEDGEGNVLDYSEENTIQLLSGYISLYILF